MNKITVDLYSVNLYFSQLHFQFSCIPAVKNKLLKKNKLGSVEWEILIYVGEWSMGLATRSHIQQCCIWPQVNELGFTPWQNAYFQSNTRTVQILVLKKILLCCLCLLKYADVFWIANKHFVSAHMNSLKS